MPDEVTHLIDILDWAGYDSYIVGGCVRDSFLDKTPHDWDICTAADPRKVLTILDLHKIKSIETGLQHGTVTAHIDGNNYEITTFRIDGEYSDNRRPDSVRFVRDVKADLARRDFTINAMAYSAWEGLVDPFGGYADLRDGIIRCVGNPDDRFQEDALRILRALRFASTYDFAIEEKTAMAIHRNKDRLKNISAERIRSELCKLLCGDGVLDILLEYKDVIAVIIPELEPCIGFDQNNPYHIYDVYDHIAHAVANYTGTDIPIKMALLLHDIGKPECYTEDEKGGHFHGHSVPSMRIAKDVVDRLKFDNKTKQEVVDLVLYHDSDIYPGTRSVRRWLNKIGPVMLDELLDVKMADIRAHSTINRSERIGICIDISDIAGEIEQESQCFTMKQLAINGHDVMNLGVEPGPKVGEILDHLLNKVIEEELENDHAILIEEAGRYLKGELS
jgi:tRNA nucleotidyltransferase (CCA-adding enzyme)